MFQFKNKNTQINPRKITSRCTSSGKGGTQGQGNRDFSASLLTGRHKHLHPQQRYAQEFRVFIQEFYCKATLEYTEGKTTEKPESSNVKFFQSPF